MKVIPRTILGISQLLLLIMAASALSAQAQTVAGSSRIVPAASLSTNQTATSQNLGSVPSGTATSEVLGLTLRDAIARAVRYNLGVIETGENARNARGQRLIALSGLLPHVTASATQTVNQISLVPSGISQARIPGVSFPADVLASFRMYSVLAQMILWVTIGLAFAPLAERLLDPNASSSDREPAVS